MIKKQRVFNALECEVCKVHPECKWHNAYEKVWRSVRVISVNKCPRLRDMERERKLLL